MNRKIWIVAGSVVAGALVVLFASRLSKSPEPEPRSAPAASGHPAIETDAKVEPQKALTAVLEISDFFARTAKLRSLFAEWVKSDPAAAAKMIVALEPKHRDYEAVESVARALSELDIPAALAFAADVQDHRVGDFIQRIALENWGRKAPADAARYILAQFPAAQQGRALGVFAKSWASTKPEAALAFAGLIKDPSAQASFMADAFDGYAQADPQNACAAWTALPLETAGRENLAAIISRNWSQTDAKAAAAWAATLPEEDASRVAALKPSIAAWSQTDPMKTAEFIDTLPRSHSRDEAILAYVDGASSAEPEAATQWAGKIDRPDLRRSAYGRIADSYAKREPSVSRQWLDSLSALPENWKNDLARRINR